MADIDTRTEADRLVVVSLQCGYKVASAILTGGDDTAIKEAIIATLAGSGLSEELQLRIRLLAASLVGNLSRQARAQRKAADALDDIELPIQ